MGRVKVCVYGVLRDKLGWKEKIVEYSSDCIFFRDLINKYLPELTDLLLNINNSLKRGFIVLINGIHIQFMGGSLSKVCNNYEVDIFPPGGGG